jgi:hypothetical protein
MGGLQYSKRMYVASVYTRVFPIGRMDDPLKRKEKGGPQYTYNSSTTMYQVGRLYTLPQYQVHVQYLRPCSSFIHATNNRTVSIRVPFFGSFRLDEWMIHPKEMQSADYIIYANFFTNITYIFVRNARTHTHNNPPTLLLLLLFLAHASTCASFSPLSHQKTLKMPRVIPNGRSTK